MSGVLKAVGKVFMGVAGLIKPLRKALLPVMAVAAVALTGGAALGVLPGLSTTIGSLGLGSTLTGVLTTAAQGATMGALGAAVTGGNVLKGATSGLLTGAALGGVNVALGAATGAAGQAAKTAATAGGTAAPGAGLSTAGGTMANTAANTAASTATQAATAAASGPLSGITNGLPYLQKALAAPAPLVSSGATAGGAGGVIGGIGKAIGGIFSNPVTAGMALQGVGAGISAATQASAERRQADQIRDNYSQFAGTRGVPTITDPGYLTFDPKTGRTYAQGS